MVSSPRPPLRRCRRAAGQALALAAGIVLAACGPSGGAARDGTGPGTTRPSSTAAPTTADTAPQGAGAGEDTTVVRVSDGDTIVVGGDLRVRLIGIDTPETQDPRVPVECFGAEASARTRALLPAGERVRLVYDVERTDRYGRTLAYVYRRSDGLFVNLALVRDGFAAIATYPPNVAHVDEFRSAERDAREANRGLWGDCPAAGPAVTSTSVRPAPSATPPAGAGGCDSSYPDVCITPAPPDLDCRDVPARRFRVVPPDPHGFDGNRDGVGCE